MTVNINKVGVLGAGLMGHGIAQGTAQAGCQVILVDIDNKELEKGRAKIQKALAKDVEKNKLLAQQQEDILNRITTSTNIKDFSDCDIVVEAVPEIMDIKKQVFFELDQICKPAAILASNTSQFSITEIASSTQRPKQVIGMHFFFPVQVMKLIEIIVGEHTGQECIELVVDLSKRMRKEICVCRDTPGFIVNRLLGSLLAEASRMYDEQLASVEDIDKAIRYGLGHPMGPFQLFDLSGIDTIVKVADGLRTELGERFNLGTGVRNKARAGNFGQKTGRGFYDYGR